MVVCNSFDIYMFILSRTARWCQYLINSAFFSLFWGCQNSALIAILKTPSGSISLNSWLLHHIINCSKYLPHIKHTQSAIYSSEAIVRHITTTSVLTTIFQVNLKAYLFTQSEYNKVTIRFELCGWILCVPWMFWLIYRFNLDKPNWRKQLV